MDGKIITTTEKTQGQILPGNNKLKMSHIEIANVAGKRSDNVKRTIERLAKEGAIATPQIEERHVQGISGSAGTNIHLMLNRLDSITVMATVEGKYCAELVQRWDNLESGRATPNALLKDQPEQSSPQALLEINMATSLKAISFAEALGFTGNQKLLSADRLLKSQIGFSPLEAMGQKQLVAPTQTMTFTPTQLGQMMAPPHDPRQMNKLLESAGLQFKIDNQWAPTDQGQSYCEILDTGKSHNSGTPVKQVKWYQTVLKLLNDSSASKPKPDAHLSNQTQSGDIGSDTDIEPVHRKQKRKRNRYELDDYFSLVELGEFITRSRQHVVEVLEKHRIIKWIGQGKRGKFLLTDKGWQYGKMYDPSEKTFHNRNSKRLTTSNAQPVLGYDILKFF